MRSIVRCDPGEGVQDDQRAPLERMEPLTPTLSPQERGEGAHYRFLPSIGVIASFDSSTPSIQLTFSATTSLPSGLVPRAKTSTPQSMQSWWRMACLLKRYSRRLSS